MRGFESHRLPNGLTILYQHTPENPVCHCALMIRAGARDEPSGKEGLAHFIEHALFKGTVKRKSHHILSRLEVVGGELNAYTTKEETCVHASVMQPHFERAAELISDIIFNSIFPEKEIEKEKEVISDEIRSYQDTPYEQIFDDFEDVIFKGHQLGHSILGKPETVRKIKRKDLLDFTRSNYFSSNMIFSVSGNLNAEKVISVAEKYFSVKRKDGKTSERKKFTGYKKDIVKSVKSVNQVHYITGTPGFALPHPERFSLVLLNNLLGGPGMNSKLNLNIREKYGYTYTIESGYHSYSDSGLFHIYFATDVKNFEKTLDLLNKELIKVSSENIPQRQFNQYKDQLTGQILMAQENRMSVLLSVAKGYLYFNRIVPLQEVLDRIAALKPADIRQTASKLFSQGKISSLTWMPASV